MISRNLTYYRLKNRMTKKELAEKANVSTAMITYYETDQKRPSAGTLKALANALSVNVLDLLQRSPDLQVSHGAFRKGCKLNKRSQELVRLTIENYLGHVFDAATILGDDGLPEPLKWGKVRLTQDVEADAQALRSVLGLDPYGPVPNLVELLESKGCFVVPLALDDESFRALSGMNGYVNGRPYIAVNVDPYMSPERNRSTIAHELAHLCFDWSGLDDKTCETLATAIGGAFLFTMADAIRELGDRISLNDLLQQEPTARKYGISMMLLGKRAEILGIASDATYRRFCIEANSRKWLTGEPWRIQREMPALLDSLVRDAYDKDLVGVERAAELLDINTDNARERLVPIPA